MIEINTWTALFYEFNPASFFALIGFEVVSLTCVQKHLCETHIPHTALTCTYIS